MRGMAGAPRAPEAWVLDYPLWAWQQSAVWLAWAVYGSTGNSKAALANPESVTWRPGWKMTWALSLGHLVAGMPELLL